MRITEVERVERVRVYGMPHSLVRVSSLPLCPGCQHGTVVGLVAEVLDELGIRENTIGISGVTCVTMTAGGIQVDAVVCCAHGRAPDVATGIKRALFGRPIVFTIQGDGDCISIGAGSLIHAALRSEKITVIMANNTNYGTTGGQLAPTTLMNQTTSTTPEGRNDSSGYPAHVPEMLAPIKGVAYAARGALTNQANYQRTKRYIKIAFEKQINNVGFSFVEILTACPTNWHLTPLESLEWIEDQLIREYPLGEFKNVDRIV